MINESSLNYETLKIILSENYGIGDVKKIQTIGTGSACIYLIINGIENKKYIVKEFQKDYSIKSISNEVDICNFLQQNNINTSEFLKNRDGLYYIKHKNRYITLQNYIEGYVIQLNKSPQWLMDSSAQLLGKIHNTLSKYKIKRYEFKKNWLSEKFVESKVNKYEEIIYKAKKLNNEYSANIINDLTFKVKSINLLYDYNFNRENITYVNSHGDYSIVQLLCKNDKINSVIDFASACNLPAIWEIIRSFSYADVSGANSEININSLKRYIKNYLLFSKLQENDLRSIFKVYSAQLILSSYGYKEYFKKDINNKDQLIKFAFWRTKLLRYILENEKQFEQDLCKWYINNYE